MHQKFAALILVLIALAVLVAAIPAPEATACEPRAVVVQKQAVVVQKTVIVENVIAAAIVQPYIVQVQVPAYSVGYDYAGMQQQQLKQELESLRTEVRALRERAALPSNVVPEANKPERSTSRGQRGMAILQSRCAKCHDATVAETKGGKHVFFKDGKIVDIDKNAGPILEQLDLGKMPKDGRLNDADLANAIWALTVREDVPKP